MEPIYGLVVMGLVHPDKVKKNSGSHAGDKLILGKPLGVGVLSAAVKKDRIDEAAYRELILNTTKLNKPGHRLSDLPGVHALTDVTGFGLLGHLLELCRSAPLGAKLAIANIPLLAGVERMAADGMVTGASGRKLGGVRARRGSGKHNHASAKSPAHRPADQRWPPGRLRTRLRGRGAVDIPPRWLRAGRDHWRNGCRTGTGNGCLSRLTL